MSITIPKRFIIGERDDRMTGTHWVAFSLPADTFGHEGYAFEAPGHLVLVSGKTATIKDGLYKAKFWKPPKGTRHKRYDIGLRDLERIYAGPIEEVRKASERLALRRQETGRKLASRKAAAVEGPGRLVRCEVGQ